MIALSMTAAPAVPASVATVAAPAHLGVSPAKRALKVVSEPPRLTSRTFFHLKAPAAAAPVFHHSAPRPQPASPPAPVSHGGIVGIILAAAARWGVNGNWMVSIARCESGLNPRAVNPSGPYYGLFQFLMSTFRANGGTNIWDPADQANITAKMLAHGQAHQWSCA